MRKKGLRAVVLLSGGLDSATTLLLAKRGGYDCRSLIIDYGQRHRREIASAKKIAARAGSPSLVLTIRLPWKGSSLLDRRASLPAGRSFSEIIRGIPSTYVPARNMILLAFAVSFAESIGAEKVFIGAHIQDSSGYPDCRREFIDAFQKSIRLGTRQGKTGTFGIVAPLIDKTKREIIRLGLALGVPFEETWSCYRGGKRPCGRCDSCRLRERGFRESGIPDPAGTPRRVRG